MKEGMFYDTPVYSEAHLNEGRKEERKEGRNKGMTPQHKY